MKRSLTLPSWIEAAQRYAAQTADWLRGRDRLELLGPLTLVLLLLYPVRIPEIQAVLQIGCIAGLLYRPVQRVPAFWIGLAVLMGIGCVLVWHDADNHKYLIAYWCLAVGLSSAADNTEHALRVNARLLVGLVFLLAVIWKLRAPDFLTGEYFEFSMLTDDRFFSIAQLFTDVGPDVYFQNREAIESLTTYSSTKESVALDGAPRIRTLATLFTGWTLFIETWVVGSFLWPRDTVWSTRARNISLLVFAGTTYFAATVSGFAWILLILGLAQAPRDSAGWLGAYLGVLGLVILYQLQPLNELLLLLEG